jgi:PiT family inorganic phosphate transporter
MFGLDTGLTLLLIFCILCACAFEFINGFHDTANAVATVIYTKSLKPMQAVVLSGIFNAVGVFAGGIAVAMAIVNLLPPESLVNQEMSQNIAMILALLFSAIIWNLGTWWLGIPASSSHTLIGSILGVGIVFSLVSPVGNLSGVNWGKASDIGLSLLISPLLGFGLTILMMALFKRFIADAAMFKAPVGDQPPKGWIRGLLILSCTGLSFTHGSNDGQKGVGLIMLILISIAPLSFAVDRSKDILELEKPTKIVLNEMILLDEVRLPPIERAIVDQVKAELFDISQVFDKHRSEGDIPETEYLNLRKDIIFIGNYLKKLKKSGNLNALGESSIKRIDDAVKEMKTFTEYAPKFVIFLILL